LQKGAQPTERAKKLLEISGAWTRFAIGRGEIHTVASKTEQEAPAEPEPKVEIVAEAEPEAEAEAAPEAEATTEADEE
jgi:hypothetical protein